MQLFKMNVLTVTIRRFLKSAVNVLLVNTNKMIIKLMHNYLFFHKKSASTSGCTIA